MFTVGYCHFKTGTHNNTYRMTWTHLIFSQMLAFTLEDNIIANSVYLHIVCI